MSVSGAKTRRFLSRKMAQRNESKLVGELPKNFDSELMQTIGPAFNERSSTAQIIQAKLKEAEDLREAFKSVYKSTSETTSAIKTLRENLKTMRKCFGKLKEVLEVNSSESAKPLVNLISETSKVHEKMIKSFEDLEESMERIIVSPIKDFVKNEIREARYSSFGVVKARVEYETQVSKLSQQKSKSNSIDSKKYKSAFQDMSVAQQKLDEISGDSLKKLRKLEETNYNENTTRMIQYLKSIQDFYREGHIMFEKISPQIETWEKEASKKKKSLDSPQVSSPELLKVNDAAKNKEVLCDDIIKILSRPDLLPFKAAQTTLSPDKLDQTFITATKILHQTSIAPSLFKVIIDMDIKKSSGPNKVLFAEDKVSSLLTTSYFKCFAKFYVSSLFGTTLKDIIKEPYALEIDPKLVSSETKLTNSIRISQFVNSILENLLQTKDLLPIAMRSFCRQIYYSCLEANVNPIPIGPIFFATHFLEPAISNPDEFGCVTEPLSVEAKRTLSLLGKIIYACVLPQNDSAESQKDAINSIADQFSSKLNTILNEFFDPNDEEESEENSEDEELDSESQIDLRIDYNSTVPLVEQLVNYIQTDLKKIVKFMQHSGEPDLAMQLQVVIKTWSEIKEQPKTS